MKILRRIPLVFCLCFFLPCAVFAEAPVVDESENYARLDDQQAAFGQPVESSNIMNDNEQPFAKEDTLSDTATNVTLLNKLQGLQQELQELRGQLEVQAHHLKLLQEQQLSFYKDLDSRISNDVTKLKNNQHKTVSKQWVEPNKTEDNTN